ncbi:hypothetical protein CN311_18955 [Mesorhizobium sanjuanii]|uniref:Glycosyl transferase n=1 Tax=Mesorhizobium sanjuanii TaxID=2037900 RepID=A0A2A6FDN9_9HYPH|nr:hypothetical protein [Mesorhizobium sanjuanii]PDQ19558.1 hypothetical protein CN311_18955 [Mesorhizobium sanjuanii]
MTSKPLKTLNDLLHQNWPVRKAKSIRNRLVEGSFRSQGVAEGRGFAAHLQSTGSRNFCFSIAFNTPWVIDVLTRAWQLHASGMTLVVIDNSSRQPARKIIEDICRARGVAYFGLPRNRETNPNRSHGIAMNWTFHNIVRHLKPELFGFLDHDCFPVAAVDITKAMEAKVAYGSRWLAKRGLEGWFLWAGLCFFRFSSVEGLDMDFTPRFERGMDTGGGNWPLLYRQLDPGDVATVDRKAVSLQLDGVQADYRMLGDIFFHVRGASHRKSIDTKRYRRLMSDHLWETYLGGGEGRFVDDV